MSAETQQINGHTFVHVKTLADQWHTTTSAILATGKPHQIPAKYRRTIDRQAWVDVEGLWKRVQKAKRPSGLDEQVWEWLLTLPDSGREYGQSKNRKEARQVKRMSSTGVHGSWAFLRNDHPTLGAIADALNSKQIILRKKNNRIQVLAQTLSNRLDTRTSSLLAVNKRQGVPQKFIHREWKRTWVDLEGLKERVENTEHGSALLKDVKQAIRLLDEWEEPPVFAKIKPEETASVSKKQQTKFANAPCAMCKQPCEVAVEANKRAVHNTERINKLTARVDSIEAGDKKATQAMREKKTPFDALSRRVSGLASHTDRLDAKTDGLESRVSVVEDTSKWLSWSLAAVLSVRLIGFTLRWLKRK